MWISHLFFFSIWPLPLCLQSLHLPVQKIVLYFWKLPWLWYIFGCDSSVSCFQNAVSMISIESVSCQSVNQSEQLDKADNLSSIEHCPGQQWDYSWGQHNNNHLIHPLSLQIQQQPVFWCSASIFGAYFIYCWVHIVTFDRQRYWILIGREGLTFNS